MLHINKYRLDIIKVTGRIKQAKAIVNIKIIRGKQNRNNRAFRVKITSDYFL